MDQGLNDGGFLVCKFVFQVSLEAFEDLALIYFIQRVPGQPALSMRTEGDTDDGDGASDDEDATGLPMEDASD